MSLSAITAGPDYLSPSRPSKRATPRKGFYRLVALVTIFAMLFGGLLLMPMSTAAASAVTTTRLNLRSGPGQEHEVLTVIPNGATVSVDGDAEAGYYPVTWDGTSGYALATFIQIGGSAGDDTGDSAQPDAPAVSDGGPTGTAWVTVNRLNFRSAPSVDSSVVAVLERGDAVELTGQQANGFWQANAVGTTGWVSSEFVTTNGAPSTPNTPTPPEETEDGDTGGSVPVGGNVTGNATTTANLNLRSGPGGDYGVIGVIPSGASIELRGESQGGYYPVSYNGTTGWAHSDWINVGTSAPAPTPDPEPTPAPGGNGSVDVGDSVTGLATTSTNLNMRSGPGMDYAVRTVIPNGSAVELRGDPQNGFHPVSYNGTTGWVHGDWLTAPSWGPLPDPEPTPTPSPGGDGSVPVGDSATGSATAT
ncbi:MAG TPA: SH3 domain-containing protein, partial [Thermomicrobiales bacterium]|nr:SH3 domain-containing protein [Thermomicrobiales bacterium]